MLAGAVFKVLLLPFVVRSLTHVQLCDPVDCSSLGALALVHVFARSSRLFPVAYQGHVLHRASADSRGLGPPPLPRVPAASFLPVALLSSPSIPISSALDSLFLQTHKLQENQPVVCLLLSLHWLLHRGCSII